MCAKRHESITNCTRHFFMECGFTPVYTFTPGWRDFEGVVVTILLNSACAGFCLLLYIAATSTGSKCDQISSNNAEVIWVTTMRQEVMSRKVKF